jgi:hypothetical protein
MRSFRRLASRTKGRRSGPLLHPRSRSSSSSKVSSFACRQTWSGRTLGPPRRPRVFSACQQGRPTLQTSSWLGDDWLEIDELTRDGLSGPLLAVPTHPDLMTVGVRAATAWEAPLLPPVVANASINPMVSPTETAAVISTVTSSPVRVSGCVMAVM